MPASAIQSLEKQIKRHIDLLKGTVGVSIKNLKTREEIHLRAEERFPTASTIKVPIMVEIFYQVKEGKIKLTDSLIYNRKKDKVGGSGVVQYLHDKLELQIMDAVYLMIILSDNTATNMLIELAGLKNINRRMESLGFPNLKVFRKSFGKKAEVEPNLCKIFGFGMATPREMNGLLELIYRGKAPDKKSCKMMIAIMRNQFYTNQLGCYIEKKGVWLANKTGSVNGVRNDIGILHTPKSDWLISVFIKHLKDQSWLSGNEGNRLISMIGQSVFHYTQKTK